MNKSKGNMYDWIDYTWNTIKGKCPHGCHYCYCKRWGEQPALHFDNNELSTQLGIGNTIFVGSSCDMWACDIPSQWIFRTLGHCKTYSKNKYVFQSKNPGRILSLIDSIPKDSIIGATIESNRMHKEMGFSPTPHRRCNELSGISGKFKKFVTIEPIMDFDVADLVDMIIAIQPKFVNIGANTSRDVKLIEPSKDKIISLFRCFDNLGFDVKLKKNLKRLLT